MLLQLTNPNNGRTYNINVPEHETILSTSQFGTGTWSQDSDGTWYGSANGWYTPYSRTFDSMRDNYIELPLPGGQFVDTSIPESSRDFNSTVTVQFPAGSILMAFFSKTEYEQGQPVTRWFGSTGACTNSIHNITTRNKSANNQSYLLSGQLRPRLSFDIIFLRDSWGDLYECLIISVWAQTADSLQVVAQTFYTTSFFKGADPVPGQTTTKTTTPLGGFGSRINDSYSVPFPDLLTISQSSVIQPDPGSHGLHIYALTLGQFSDLYAEMWSTNLFRQLNNSKYTPMQGIGALHKMACSSPAEPTAYNIRLAGATLKTTGFICQTQFVESAVYSAQIPRYSGTFLDFAPHTQIMLHLPFIGTVSIDPDLVVGGGLQVKYIFDLLQGNCTATVRYYDRFGNDSVYGSYNGNCAYQCIVSGSDNGFPAVRGALQTFATGAVDFGSGNFAGAAAAAIAGGINIATAQHHFSRQGNSGGNSAAIGCTDLFVKITMPQDVDTTNIPGGQGNYRVNNLGYPAAGGGKVEDYTGHYVEAVVHADIPGATAAEKRRIEQAMSGGLFV